MLTLFLSPGYFTYLINGFFNKSEIVDTETVALIVLSVCVFILYENCLGGCGEVLYSEVSA